MVSAIENEYPPTLKYSEIHSIIPEKNVYKNPAKIVGTNNQNQTLTLRWLPMDEGHFPSGLKMLIVATMEYFGTSNLTIDMTPSMKNIFFFVDLIHISCRIFLGTKFYHRKCNIVDTSNSCQS